MSIFATIFQIEDERQWVAGLEAEGIRAGVIRDGDPAPEDLDAPYVYQGSHILPADDALRGGSVELACIPAHVRFWREHPDAPVDEEPDGGCEPWLRLSVDESALTPHREPGFATVLLDLAQAIRLQRALGEWIVEAETTLAAAS